MRSNIASFPGNAKPWQPVAGVRIRDLLGRYPVENSSDPATNADEPNVCFNEWDPGYVARPHFHAVDQFQLFVRGTGQFGKHKLRPGSIQYANAYTPYGPIEAGPAGLAFLLIRARTDAAVTYVPAPAHLRKGRKPRSYIFDVDMDRPDSAIVAGPYDDGLEIHRRFLEPDAELEFSAPQACGGQIGVVLSGEISTEKQSYPAWSCIFAAPGKATRDIRAGEHGSDLLVLRFPIPVPD